MPRFAMMWSHVAFVEHRCDRAQGRALRTHPPHISERRLLDGIFHEPIALASEAEGDEATVGLPLRALVCQRCRCSLADRLALPLTDAAHEIEHQPAHRASGVDALREADDRDVALLGDLKQFCEVDDAASEAIELHDDDALDLPASHAVEQLGDSRPLQALGAASGVADDL